MPDFLISLLAVVVILGFMILIHEFGHFAVAKWLGVRVEQFAIGFGKRLVGFRRGETDYRINAIPLGGYVKFLGDENAASAPDQSALAAMSETDKKESFAGQSVGSRAAVNGLCSSPSGSSGGCRTFSSASRCAR